MNDADKHRNWLTSAEGARLTDSAGNRVKCYDHVVALEPLAVDHAVRTDATEVPVGCIGAVIMITADEPVIAEIEWDIGEGFAFANARAEQLRLHRTAEQKRQKNA